MEMNSRGFCSNLKSESTLTPEMNMVTPELADIIDAPAIQSLMDDFYKLAHIPMSIVDLKGNVLVGVGWKDICVKFHRVHPETRRHCIDSDTKLSAGVPAGEFKLYKCRNNMWDVATPIMVNGQHLGNIFMGQFFFDDETPDYDLFRSQAGKYGFNEKEYLAALDAVPRVSRETVNTGMAYFMKLASIISQLSYSNINLARSLTERDALMNSLRESEKGYRKLASQLDQQRSLLRALLDSIPDLIFYKDCAGVYLGCNKAFEAFAGRPEKKLAGLTDLDLFSREVAEFFRDMDRQMLSQGTARQNEEWVDYPDGRRILLDTLKTPFYAHDGKTLGLIGISRDITGRKRVEDALRKSEERYALAVQGTNDGIWDVDLASGEVYFSSRWKSMLGYEDDEIPNEIGEWIERIHPDDLQMVMDAREMYLEDHRPAYEVEYRLQHKNGFYRWVLSRGACMRDPQGVPYRFSGSHTDITERMTLEQAVRESEKKYRTLFEESKDMVFIVDAAGRMSDINPAGTELLGYTKEELLAKSIGHDFGIPLKVREDFLETLTSFGFVKDFELELKKKDGARVVVHFSATVVRDDTGKVVGYRGIAHDVTERRRLEQQLVQAQRMESIGMLAGGIAHDFNNLLTAISGYGEMIRDNVPADDELLLDCVDQVLKASERATELTRGLLAFSRKQVIHPKPVLVNTIVRNTGKWIRRIIGEDIEFSTNLSERKLPVMADISQLEQVLMNLATNARDAMPCGGLLRIATEEALVQNSSEADHDMPKPGKYARISVSDTGTGIEEKYLDRIFEPFFTTKEIGKGTGLGLAMIYGAIKQHNGSILVTSEPGKGTTFSIYLPIIDEGLSMGEKRNEVGKPAFGGSETILIAEDEEMVRTFMKKSFERVGYRVLVAVNGEEAVAKFSENREDISLILSDIIMPRKNGREILEEVRKMKPGIKVMFVSGYTANIMHEKGIFEEGVDFITKPFVQDTLLRKVREVLDKA